MVRHDSERVAAWYEVDAEAQPWFLEDEDVPETPTHDRAIRLLVELLEAWCARSGRDVLVARNLGCRWDPDDARRGMDPDVVLLEPAPADPEAMTTLRTYDPAEPRPRLAVEVVSPWTADKDYGDAHLRAARIGADELWVFDPRRVGPSSAGGPFRLQLWRRVPGDLPTMRRVHAGEGPVFSPLVGAWLVVSEGGARLRLADDPAGARLWPASAERAAEAEREAEAARSEAEAARSDAQAARSELEAVRREAEAARIRAERAEAEAARRRAVPGDGADG